MTEENKEILDFQVEGYEDLEISTQIVVGEALERGLTVEILDRANHFIRLRSENKSELIQQATKTRLDSYMTYLVMENKVVTKLLLAEAGVRVPSGEHYNSLEEAAVSFGKFKDQNIVIKPVTTNFGIGVTLLNAPFSEDSFKRTLESAFDHDGSVIVESLVEGKEYRFLVIGGEVKAVCHRVPANVIGDDESTVKELVALKNEDPRRGKGHRKPLEVIETGEVEKEFLSSQGKNFEYVPEKGEVVYLRGNSNISTGGDSIDVTDLVNPGYLEIAEKAGAAVGSAITGIDMMIKDPVEKPHFSNHAIIEANFNPVLFIHEYPYQGEGRPVGAAVLDLLGFPAE